MQAPGDLLVRQAAGDETHHLELTCAEAARGVAARSRGAERERHRLVHAETPSFRPDALGVVADSPLERVPDAFRPRSVQRREVAADASTDRVAGRGDAERVLRILPTDDAGTRAVIGADDHRARAQPYASRVLTIAAVVLALTVIPSPWNAVAVAGAFAVDVAETVVFLRWSRRRRSVVGSEALVGRTAVAVSPLAPRGQVKVDGELWLAAADTRVEPGDEVVVTGVDGLLLRVETRT